MAAGRPPKCNSVSASEKEATMAEAPSSSSPSQQSSNVPLVFGVAVKYWIEAVDGNSFPDETHEQIFDGTKIEPVTIGLSPGQVATKVRAHLLKIQNISASSFAK